MKVQKILKRKHDEWLKLKKKYYDNEERNAKQWACASVHINNSGTIRYLFKNPISLNRGRRPYQYGGPQWKGFIFEKVQVQTCE